MSEERKRILDMVAKGKISVEEAEKLLDALGAAEPEEPAAESGGKKPRFVRVVCCESGKGKVEKINLRIPVGMLKSGVKLGSLMPEKIKDKVSQKLKEKGIEIDVKKSEALEDVLKGLCDCDIDIDTDGENVKIFCE
jgi:hypothetical protein